MTLLRLALLAALLSTSFTSCMGYRKVVDPVLSVRTSGGTELGVSTEYGVVFTGATAERGEVEVEAWFADGPSLERSVIEPVGHKVFTAQIDIELPSVPISFREPRDGERLVIMGRRGWERWTAETKARVHPGTLGVLVDIPSGFPDDPDQVGAGVFRKVGSYRYELVGLVTGKVTLPDGRRTRRYLAVAGPIQLARLAAHRRDLLRKKPFVYREDIL